MADSFIHPNYTWNDKEYDIGLVSSLTTCHLSPGEAEQPLQADAVYPGDPTSPYPDPVLL